MKKYSPDQDRDEHGRWTSGGSSDEGSKEGNAAIDKAREYDWKEVKTPSGERVSDPNPRDVKEGQSEIGNHLYMTNPELNAENRYHTIVISRGGDWTHSVTTQRTIKELASGNGVKSLSEHLESFHGSKKVLTETGRVKSTGRLERQEGITMLKTVEQLAKAFGDLRQHFKKAAAHHEALSAAHAGLAEADKAHHEFVKAKAEAMDDGDLNKTYFGKCSDLHKARAAFHVQKSALHKVHAAHLASLAEETAEGEAEKAVGAGTDNKGKTETASAAPGSVEGMVKATTDELVKSALEMVKTDPTVKEEIKKMVLEAVKGGLGDKIVPTSVKTVLPTHPTGPMMVPRPGGPPAPVEGVPVEFEDLVKV